MHVEADHLVLACRDLDSGSSWLAQRLGAEPVEGGQHAFMGTHNRLLQISSPSHARTYLELIAIDPDAPAPARPRWFGLDDPALQARLVDGPELVAWAGRSPQIDMHRWGLITIGLQPGTTLSAERKVPGMVTPLRWQIVLRDDGATLLGGAVPVLIQWMAGHPCDRLPASPVTLQRLAVRGLPPRARDVMRLRGVQGDDAADAPALSATFVTPLGEVVLRSAA
ncbi:VOC family protein [Sphaerotilus mobilis]|uniref:Glyoxalase-like protein n=1 Tax=Sphaerotilus mobilis TaxID=47994 RepID=A0A4Q7LGI2_9BURK|nr:VOC family protein [Sphaerotilus mobilis]RZS53202.1 glyoxalase-like protein [Sphaerotilus mobilis]